jgi:apolipoprotein N-acyltransferase
MESEQSIPAVNARPFNVCGWLSIACCLPYLVVRLGGEGLANFMDSIGLWVAVLFFVFLSPLAGAVLALIASIKRRWWLVLAAAWIAVFVYLCWDLHKHPIVI